MASHISDPPYLGDYKEDETVHFLWNTFDDNNASVTRATDGTVQVYKDNGATQSTAGITDTEDFDSLTGLHACTIDLSADAFYEAGANYTVVVAGAVVAGDTLNAAIAHFSIENRAPIQAIGAPSAIDSGAATLAGMLLKMIDDNAGADFDATTDSLEKIGNRVGTPVALDGGAATLAGMLTKLADDNGGVDFDAEIDSLNKNSITKLLATNVDTVALSTIITEILARTSGKYTVDDPTAGDITFKKRDNTTTSHVINVTGSGRTRTSP